MKGSKLRNTPLKARRWRSAGRLGHDAELGGYSCLGRWNRGYVDLPGDDALAEAVELGADVVDEAAAVGEAERADGQVHVAHAGSELAVRVLLDERVDRPVVALEHRREDVRPPRIALADLVIQVGVDAYDPQMPAQLAG